MYKYLKSLKFFLEIIEKIHDLLKNFFYCIIRIQNLWVLEVQVFFQIYFFL